MENAKKSSNIATKLFTRLGTLKYHLKKKTNLVKNNTEKVQNYNKTLDRTRSIVIPSQEVESC